MHMFCDAQLGVSLHNSESPHIHVHVHVHSIHVCIDMHMLYILCN